MSFVQTKEETNELHYDTDIRGRTAHGYRGDGVHFT
jgi:hypothetical protein